MAIMGYAVLNITDPQLLRNVQVDHLHTNFDHDICQRFCIGSLMAEADYSNYMHVSPDLELWGLNLVAAGKTTVLPNRAHDSEGDPSGFASNASADKGRILDALHLLLIRKGRGHIEYKPGEPIELVTGSTCILLPGKWHRLRPDPVSGWQESWIEMRGSLLSGILSSDGFDAANRIRQSSIGGRIDFVLELIHSKARMLGSSTAELSAYGMQILAFWLAENAEDSSTIHTAMAMARAERILSGRCMQPISIADIAAEVGMSYSHFRRELKQRTGYSPWQYVMRMRLTRVCRLLLTTDNTLEQIAAAVGFNSAFHLSTQFRKQYGLPPRKWQEQLVGLPRPASQ